MLPELHAVLIIQKHQLGILMCHSGCNNFNTLTRWRSPFFIWETWIVPGRSAATYSGFWTSTPGCYTLCLSCDCQLSCYALTCNVCVTSHESSDLFTPNHGPQAKFCPAVWSLMLPLFVSTGEEVWLPRMLLWILEIWSDWEKAEHTAAPSAMYWAAILHHW